MRAQKIVGGTCVHPQAVQRLGRQYTGRGHTSSAPVPGDPEYLRFKWLRKAQIQRMCASDGPVFPRGNDTRHEFGDTVLVDVRPLRLAGGHTHVPVRLTDGILIEGERGVLEKDHRWLLPAIVDEYVHKNGTKLARAVLLVGDEVLFESDDDRRMCEHPLSVPLARFREPRVRVGTLRMGFALCDVAEVCVCSKVPATYFCAWCQTFLPRSCEHAFCWPGGSSPGWSTSASCCPCAGRGP